MIAILMAIVAACAIGFGASLVFTWASRQSAVWNIGFGIVLVLTAATVVIVALTFLTRGISD